MRPFAGNRVRRNPGWLIGEEGDGVARIVEMVNFDADGLRARLHCASARVPRRRDSSHRAYRRAFGTLLIDHPLMQNVLADLALDPKPRSALPPRRPRD